MNFAVITKQVESGALQVSQQVGAMIEWVAQEEDVAVLQETQARADAIAAYLSQRSQQSVAEHNAAIKLQLAVKHRLGEVLAKTAKRGRPSDKNLQPVSIIPKELGDTAGQRQIASYRAQQVARVPLGSLVAKIDAATEQGKAIKAPGTVLKEVEREQKSQEREQRRLEALQAASPDPGKLVTDASDIDLSLPWQIVLGDCRNAMEGLPPESARLVFADPPYNIGVDYGDGKHADALPEDIHAAWAKEWLAGAHRVLTEDGSLWVLISDEYAAEYVVWAKAIGFALRNWVIWSESFGVQAQGKFSRLKRHLLYFTKGKECVFNADAVRVPSARQEIYDDPRADPRGKVMGDIWTDIPRLAGTHAERIPSFPTQLPIALPARVVAVASDPGDLVIDPFNGSGTTGVACLRACRRYLGIELREHFATLAAQRLESEAS